MIIGISGKKRHGKGTAAAILVQEYGFTQIDFADALRGDMATLDPIVSTWENYSPDGVGEMRYNDAIRTYGYESAKEEFPEIVRLLQVYGTEVGRRRIHNDLWLNRWEATIQNNLNHPKIVVSDVRFQNEVERVETVAWPAEVHFLGVCRPGYVHDVAADKHASEQLPKLPKGKTTRIEAATVDALKLGVHYAMGRLGFSRPAASAPPPTSITAPPLSQPTAD